MHNNLNLYNSKHLWSSCSNIWVDSNSYLVQEQHFVERVELVQLVRLDPGVTEKTAHPITVS